MMALKKRLRDPTSYWTSSFGGMKVCAKFYSNPSVETLRFLQKCQPASCIRAKLKENPIHPICCHTPGKAEWHLAITWGARLWHTVRFMFTLWKYIDDVRWGHRAAIRIHPLFYLCCGTWFKLLRFSPGLVSILHFAQFSFVSPFNEGPSFAHWWLIKGTRTHMSPSPSEGKKT